MTTNGSAQSVAAPVIPNGLSWLLEKPPLLSDEDRAIYQELLGRISAAQQPEDCIVWLFVKGFVDLTLDIRRWGLVRQNVINMTRKDALVNILESLLGKEDIPEGSDRAATAEALAEKWFADPDSRIPVKRILNRLDLNSTALDAHAVVLKLGDLHAIEQLIESAERRRNQILRQIELYRGGLASRLRNATTGFLEPKAQPVALLPNVGDNTQP